MEAPPGRDTNPEGMPEPDELVEAVEQQQQEDENNNDDDDDNNNHVESELSFLRERLAAAERQNLRLTDDLDASATMIRDLEENNAGLQKGLLETKKELEKTKKTLQNTKESMAIDMLWAVGQGLTGWAPSLPFHLNSRQDDPAGNNPPGHNIGGNRMSMIATVAQGWGEKIWARIRKPFFVFTSFVDCSDSIFDLYVSISDIANGSCDGLNGWAVWLLIMTILARTLGGVFGVVYTFIDDEFDLELTYFLVELTIFFMEDAASFFYITLKKYKFGTLSGVDRANQYLTIVCGILFIVPTLWRYKRIAKNLSPLASRIFLVWYGLLFLWFCSFFVAFPYIGTGTFSRETVELLVRVIYSSILAVQLFVLYIWSHYLYRKRTSSRQQLTVDPGNTSV